MKRLLVLVSLVMIMMGVGCAALSHYITWAEIDRDAVGYAVEAGVADANEYVSIWPNMVLAERLMRDVDAAHLTIQQTLEHLIQKDDLVHSIHQDVATSNYTASQGREKTLFGDKGLLSLGLSMAGFGGFTGLIGLMRKRPGDITAPEMEQALATATGETSAQLSAKSKQFVQLVKGVQYFIDSGPAGSDVALLKAGLDKHQDMDTKAAVAVVKKTS